MNTERNKHQRKSGYKSNYGWMTLVALMMTRHKNIDTILAFGQKSIMAQLISNYGRI